MRNSHTTLHLALISTALLAPAIATAQPVTGPIAEPAAAGAPAAPTATPAAADDAPTAILAAQPRRYAFGVRVGGYGFRNPEGDRRNGWDDCRMNGMGVFGERRMGEHAFVEAGADLYFSEAFPFEPAAGEDQMSRLSGLLSVAGGLRMFPRSRVSAYAQIGAGLELTRVAMGTGAEQLTDNRALPTAFVGFGGDLRLSERAVIGMNLRAFAMGHFDHGHGDVVDAGHGDVVDAGHGAGLDVEPEAAAQGQFYLKYSL